MTTNETTYEVNVFCESGKTYKLGECKINRLEQLTAALWQIFLDAEDVAKNVIITKCAEETNNDNP